MVSKKNLKSRLKNFFSKYYYLCIVVFCIIFFGSLYGYRLINPFYTEWVLNLGASSWLGDIFQHYVGWEAYRAGSWTFPFGLINNISYPSYVSVIFTDSIPILAFIFKVFSFLLPKSFQYFGLYVLLCFILQGLIACKIFSKFTDSKLCIIFSSLILACSPIMIVRAFYHTSLTSHWLLLIALETLFLYDSFKDDKKIYYIWGLLAFLCVSIHFYFLPMCGIILLGFCLLDILKTKKVFKSIKLLLIFLAISVFTLFIFGGFVKAGNLKEAEYGYFSFNMNGFFNSLDLSSFINKLPVNGEAFEGFSYLGLSGIILLIVAVIILGYNFIKDRKKVSDSKYLFISLVFISLICILFALSPKAYFGKTLVYNLKIPNFVDDFWMLFRSCGRVVWPVVYIIMFGSIIVVLRFLNKKWALILLVLCFFIHMAEFGEFFNSLYDLFYDITYNNAYRIDDAYNTYKFDYLKKALKNDELKLLVFVSEDADAHVRGGFIVYTDWAVNNGLMTSNFDFVRRPMDLYFEKKSRKFLEKIDSSKIYLFFDDKECSKYSKLYCYKLPDGTHLGYSKKLD